MSLLPKKEKIVKKGEINVCKSMKDYSNEAFFVKKMEAAKEILGKYGLPSESLILKYGK